MEKQVMVKELDLRKMFYSKLKESEEQYKDGKISSAEVVFQELRDRYNY